MVDTGATGPRPPVRRRLNTHDTRPVESVLLASRALDIRLTVCCQ
jgi:hypothetical protein